MMEPLDILREATAAAKVFNCENSTCRESGELINSELGPSALLRACGSVKGASVSISGDEIFKIIFHGSNINVAFVKQQNGMLGLVWQEAIESQIQISRIDAAIKSILEAEKAPTKPEPEVHEPEIHEPEVHEPEVPKPAPEEPAPASVESSAITESSTGFESSDKAELPPPEKEEEISPKEKEPPPPEKFAEKPPVIEPPKKTHVYNPEVIGRIEEVLEKYLEDFSSVIFDNEISDLGIKIKGAEFFSAEQIELLVKKLHDAASLIVGGGTAEQMQEDILQSIKDNEREV
ncbi:hypothetical protein JW890_01190 [candidate division WOR-3 bacterium]|nr:hypothetical protein [candidate division WOR-3 bacterium]